jgi:lantibiotic biosynthesis protein
MTSLSVWPDDLLVDRDPAHAPEPAWVDWLLKTYPKDSGGEAHRAFQERRREAVALIDPYGDWSGLRARPGGEALVASWARRAQAIAEYGSTLRRISPPWVTPSQVLNSLFHLHHNRLLGIDRQSEQATYAVARGAVQARRDRRRHLG